MDFVLNDLSLHGQFKDSYDFQPSLNTILGIRETLRISGHGLHCTSKILIRLIDNERSFNEIIFEDRFRDLRVLILNWLTKDGPFWDRPPEHDFGADFFTLSSNHDCLLTTSALAEAAFRIADGKQSCSVSFSPSNFCFSPIETSWHRESAILDLPLPNLWTLEHLKEILHQIPDRVTSWQELLELSRSQYRHLHLIEGLEQNIKGIPFQHAAAQRILELLRILDEFRQCFDENGKRTVRGNEIYQMHFQGATALFSDESDSNKRAFENALTFKLPTGEDSFCPYHGKVRTGVFRVHFTWPVTADSPLYIVYIGPKITKH